MSRDIATTPHSNVLRVKHEMRLATEQEVEKIQAALAAKTPPQPNSAAVMVAKASLEDCLARRALNEATEEEEIICRDKLLAAEDVYAKENQTYAENSLGIDGLRRRLVTAESAAQQAKHDFDEAEAKWLYEEILEADAAYLQTAEALSLHYRRVLMCVQLLKSRGVLSSHIIDHAEISIPSIGATSAAAIVKKYQAAHGVGKMIFDHHTIQFAVDKNQIENEIQFVLTKESSPLKRMAKIVGLAK